MDKIFGFQMSFFSHIHRIDWKKCSDVCADSAKLMTGRTVNVMPRIKDVSKMCVLVANTFCTES
jgi:hypothetical protein